mmetsp:Transcript_8518/g.24243  ORF Transcript_8518/g.24243 Transcript_8518/m.24243 type:complete len:268 (-) Transcript_8518:43-846(-)
MRRPQPCPIVSGNSRGKLSAEPHVPHDTKRPLSSAGDQASLQFLLVLFGAAAGRDPAAALVGPGWRAAARGSAAARRPAVGPRTAGASSSAAGAGDIGCVWSAGRAPAARFLGRVPLGRRPRGAGGALQADGLQRVAAVRVARRVEELDHLARRGVDAVADILAAGAAAVRALAGRGGGRRAAEAGGVARLGGRGDQFNALPQQRLRGRRRLALALGIGRHRPPFWSGAGDAKADVNARAAPAPIVPARRSPAAALLACTRRCCRCC